MREGNTADATRTDQKALLVFAHRLWDDAEAKAKKNSKPKKVLHRQYMVFVCKWTKAEATTVLR